MPFQFLLGCTDHICRQNTHTHIKKVKKSIWVMEMGPWGEVLAIKPDDLISASRTHMAERGNKSFKLPSDLHTQHSIHT